MYTVAERGRSSRRPGPTRVQLRNMTVAGVLLLVGGQGLAAGFGGIAIVVLTAPDSARP